MLSIQNVHKSFGDNEVLKGVSLEVSKGDVVVILGPSGSGKTTLLRSINFLERADEGTLDWGELHLDLRNASRKEVASIRKKTAFVFQNYNLFKNKTALENVMEGLTVARKIPKKEAEEIAKKATDIENDIKEMKKNIIDSDKKKVNIDVLDAESNYHRLISAGRKKEEKVQVYKRNSNMTYEVERLKDSMTSEEAILIQAKRAGIDNGRIVTSITNISQDIKKLEKYGICMKKDCFDELEKIILDNYLDIECTHSEFIDNDIPKAVIDAFVQKCCNEMKKKLDEYRSKDGKNYDVRKTK